MSWRTHLAGALALTVTACFTPDSPGTPSLDGDMAMGLAAASDLENILEDLDVLGSGGELTCFDAGTFRNMVLRRSDNRWTNLQVFPDEAGEARYIELKTGTASEPGAVMAFFVTSNRLATGNAAGARTATATTDERTRLLRLARAAMAADCIG